MRAYIIDERHMSKKGYIEGAYDQGVFKYKDGGFPIFKWGAIDKSIKIDGELAIKETIGLLRPRNIETVYVAWKGKEYQQISFVKTTMKDQTSYSDLIRDEKIGHYIKRAMIAQPKNTLQDIINIVLIILLVATLTSTWYASQTVKDMYSPTLKLVNNTLTQVALQNRLLLNQTQSLGQLIRNQAQQNNSGNLNGLPRT